MPIPQQELVRLLQRLAQELSGMECERCGAVSQRNPCSTCEAMAYARGDAFTRLCFECERGFVTADPNRDLCCFCMKRTGENHGRNRRTHSSAPRHTDRATDQGPSRAPAWTREPSPCGALKDTSIRTGEIIAWRTWYVTNTTTGLRLRSMAVDCIWEPNEPVSVNSVLEQCGYHNDGWERIPPGIGAGIHAFKDPQEAVNQYRLGEPERFWHGRALG